ncbi:MAG: ABC transporter permease [Christensenella sp.]
MILKKLKTSDFWYSNLFYILAIIFVIGFGIANPKFLDGANIANIFAQSSVLIIMSIGMALALITKGMDMSVGSTLFLCAATMQILNKNFDIGMPEMMMISIAVGLAAGALNGFIVSMFNVYPLLPTLATMFAYKGIALIIGGGGSATMPMFWSQIISARVGPVPIHVFIAIGIAIVVQLLLNNTKTGRHIYALGDSEKTSHEKGIDERKIKVLVYTLSGLMCGIAAIIFSAQSMSVPASTGSGMEFKCVIAATLGGVSMFGGKGTVAPGVIIGALIMSIISNVLVVSAASAYIYTVVYGLVILFVVLLDTLKNKKMVNA